MRISGQWLSGAVVLVMAILLGSARPALADSYTIFDLGNDNGHGIYGIDTAGDVVIWGGNGCGMSASTCYVTYTNGIATSDSSTAPDLVYDDGTSCGSTPAGFNASKKVCNNGWIGLGTLYNPNGWRSPTLRLASKFKVPSFNRISIQLLLLSRAVFFSSAPASCSLWLQFVAKRTGNQPLSSIEHGKPWPTASRRGPGPDRRRPGRRLRSS